MRSLTYLAASTYILIRDLYLIHIKKPRCSLCGQVATLQNDDGSWICDNCAQSMSEFGGQYDSKY